MLVGMIQARTEAIRFHLVGKLIYVLRPVYFLSDDRQMHQDPEGDNWTIALNFKFFTQRTRLYSEMVCMQQKVYLVL